MPKYKYYCGECLEISTLWHGVTEKMTECPTCGAKDCLTRVPSEISNFKKIDKVAKKGDLVKEHISESKKELNRQKQIARQGYKNDSDS